MLFFYKTIVFSYSRLKTCFRFENKFQILPLDMNNKPQCPYAFHYPIFLEYTIDFQDKEPEDVFELQAIRINKEKEIINLLSCLTNHRFFSYDQSKNAWGVMMPDAVINDMTQNEVDALNNQESNMFIAIYKYNGMGEDLHIECFTEYYPKANLIRNDKHLYYTNNPIDDNQHDIFFPETIYYALHQYYNLSLKTRQKVNSSIYLACDGIDISANKRSLSFLSYVSAIEGLVDLDSDNGEIKFCCKSCQSIEASPYKCPTCGRPIWGVKQKFINFLSKYVAGSEDSHKKYSDIYNLRSKLTHTGKLFLGDYDMSFEKSDLERKYMDGLMRLETLQLFRISLDCWLRNSEKKKKL